MNVEIKAKCYKPRNVRRILKSKNAFYKGRDHQVDTYFKVSGGRLKLREGKIENYLIYYVREDKKGPKKSTVILLKAEPKSPLKEMLVKALEVLVVVEKHRDIYFIDNVKFHIDAVTDLGSFIEIEAMDNKKEFRTNQLLNQCKYYLELFEVSDKDLISCSYCDLMLDKINVNLNKF